MFGTETIGKGLSFVKILSGLNKTLSIANQMIPIYQQAKPMIQNAKSAFRVLKEFTSTSSSSTSSTASLVTKPSKDKPKQLVSSETKKEMPHLTSPASNLPVFFV